MEEISRGKLPYVNSGLFAMYLNKAFEKLYGIKATEFHKIKKESPTELDKFRINIFFDKDKIIITRGSKVQAMRPPGINIDLWRAFVAYLIHEYGAEEVEHAIIATMTKMIKEKIITYLRILNIDVPVAKFDPSKLDKDVIDRLPKDLRDFVLGLDSTNASKKTEGSG